MALWQFTVIAVLMGALLVHTSCLTLRVGRANAALKRIEDALLAKVEVVTPAPVAPAEPTPPLELTDMEDSAARYLTIRDLKVRSERRRSQATASLERPPTPDMSGKFASLLFGRRTSDNPVTTGAESNGSSKTEALDSNTEALSTSADELNTSIEALNISIEALHAKTEALGLHDSEAGTFVPVSPPPANSPNTNAEFPEHASQAESEHSAPPSAEPDDAPNASTEAPHSPASPTVNEDTVEQREREALLFQSNQRRRRRARQGY